LKNQSQHSKQNERKLTSVPLKTTLTSGDDFRLRLRQRELKCTRFQSMLLAVASLFHVALSLLILDNFNILPAWLQIAFTRILTAVC